MTQIKPASDGLPCATLCDGTFAAASQSSQPSALGLMLALALRVTLDADQTHSHRPGGGNKVLVVSGLKNRHQVAALEFAIKIRSVVQIFHEIEIGDIRFPAH